VTVKSINAQAIQLRTAWRRQGHAGIVTVAEANRLALEVGAAEEPFPDEPDDARVSLASASLKVAVTLKHQHAAMVRAAAQPLTMTPSLAHQVAEYLDSEPAAPITYPTFANAWNAVAWDGSEDGQRAQESLERWVDSEPFAWSGAPAMALAGNAIQEGLF
jgi:hypothetical protein